MGSFGGYYKGEKKKPKKGKDSKGNLMGTGGMAPTFTPPEVISKKKKNDW